MRLLIFALILFGGLMGGAASTADEQTAMLLGGTYLVMALAGGWLLFDSVDRRRP
jgi:hypothetical protein